MHPCTKAGAFQAFSDRNHGRRSPLGLHRFWAPPGNGPLRRPLPREAGSHGPRGHGGHGGDGGRNGPQSSFPPVLEALRRVPRHRFVPEKLVDAAYENRPLPIGYGQTISQPFIVALMTELLDLPENATVLEIGTGSGYQAAVLAEIARDVFTVEIIPELGRSAQARLQELGYGNVHVKIGDGYFGWDEHAPFDAIMVTAAAPHIPPPLVRQLKPGGTLVLPVGPPFLTQYLTVVQKARDGTLTTRQILPVAFVPLTTGRGTP